MLENFFNKCFTNDFDKSCYYGYVFLSFGILVLIFNLYAFLKMTKYYGKLNFENSILFLSSIQSYILITQMITSNHFFICIFISIQILTMNLINNKFEKISIGYVNIKCSLLNKIIIIINILYLISYITLYIKMPEIEFFILNVFYFLLEICSSFYLAYHCSIFLGLIKQDKNKLNNKKEEMDKIDNNKEYENFIGINMIGDGLFYIIKKKQLSLLYYSNIICSIFELGFDIILFISDKNSSSIYLIYYIDFFIFFIHNSIIFISFFWLVRKQYISENRKNLNNEENKKNLIDEKFIEEEEILIEEENKRITKYLNDEKNSYRVNNGSIEIKISEADKGSIQRKPSRNSSFDENVQINNLNVIKNEF